MPRHYRNQGVLSYIYHRQPILGLMQKWFRELSLPRLECVVHDKLHISSADWWYLLLPLADTPARWDQRLIVSHPKDPGNVGNESDIISRNCSPTTQNPRGRCVDTEVISSQTLLRQRSQSGDSAVTSSLDTLVQRHRRPGGSHQFYKDTDDNLVINYL